MATSGTYNFQTIEVETVIREAFERIGVISEYVEYQKLESARRSINLILLDWMNRPTNLWTLQKSYLGLNPSQGSYTLPDIVNNVVQLSLRVSNRNLNGTPQTNTGQTYDNGGGGVAANAFDGNPATACTQNVQNGNISYDYGAGTTQNVTFIGIQSNGNTNYTLAVEASQDAATWVNLLSIPIQTFNIGQIFWFDIPVPINARYYRVRETAAATLNVQEIYFNNNVYDYQISDVSRWDFYSYPAKNTIGRPTVFYLDRQPSNPVLNLWPVPDGINYNCIWYSYEKMMQDAGLYTNSLELPSRFYPPLIWGLSYHLALKYAPDKAQLFKAEYEQSYAAAAHEDTENVSFNINADYNFGGGS